MNQKITTFLTVLLLLVTQTNLAQEHTITGTVTDETGMPLPGVNVMIKGTTNGLQTDFDGNFSLGASPGDIMVFSFIGLETAEIPVENGDPLNVVLKENSAQLDEVVIVGYGTQRRSEVTGSISNVSGEAVAELPVQSFESALGGRATGVNITANAGVLNSAPVFRIRGTNSLSLSSYPLIVVDGVPMFTAENESNLSYASTNPMSSINPADIESIDIAKDAAATSIYGSRAANGVVFITTKRGKKGSTRVSLESWVGYTTANNLPDVLNAAQYLEIKNEGLRNEGTFDPETNYYDFSYDADGNIIDTDWSDHVYQTGFSHNNNLSISGATESTRYYGSVGYTEQEGIFKENSFDRKSVLFNISNNTTNWLEVGAKINYINENNASAMPTGRYNAIASGALSRVALISAPIVGPYNNDGSYNMTTNGYLGLMDNFGHLNQSRLGFVNPASSMAQNYSNNTVEHVQSNAYASVKPTSWLTLKSLYGIDYRQTNYDIYYSPHTFEGRSSGGTANSATNKMNKWVWTNTLNIDKIFAEKHSVNILLGQEQQKTDGNQFGLQRTGQTDPLYSNIQGGFQNVFDWNTNNRVYDNYLFSLFGRLQYNYLQKYFLTANFRQDDYSALGINNKTGTFWGFSAGWEIMQEQFWSDTGLNNIFSNFKIRASYGKVGNVGGLGDFAALNTYSAALYGGQPGLIYSATGNPDLEWETSKKFDVGVNFGFLDNRITGEVAYYMNNIDGLIFGVPVPPSAGIPNATDNTVMQNVGEMYNKGWEFALSGTPILKENFTWSSSFNLSTNKNEVTALAEGVRSIIPDRYSITLPGHPVGMIYAVRTAGIDPASGRRIFLDSQGREVYYQHVVTEDSPAPYKWAYADGSEAPPITPANDAVPYENTAPKVFGGFSNNFSWKGLELNVLLTYQLGGNLYNGTQAGMRDQRFWNNSTDVLRRWQQPGDVTDIARIVNGDNISMGNTMAIDDNISSSDFLRLKNVTLAYNLPSSWVEKVDLSNVRLYISGQNLALWTKYSGMDPEISTNANNPMTQGIDWNQSPNARTITLGVNVTF